MNTVAKRIIGIVWFVVALALVIGGHRNFGVPGLIVQLVGLTGLLVLLFVYNRKYR